MNRDQLAGNWKQIQGALMRKWGKLTDDDLAVAKGNLTALAGRLQERYGMAKEEAERQLAEFISRHENDSHEEGGTKTNPEVATEGAPVDAETLKIGMK
jgi:uncharacterized protein YjbJ (UPF0337 family)